MRKDPVVWTPAVAQPEPVDLVTRVASAILVVVGGFVFVGAAFTAPRAGSRGWASMGVVAALGAIAVVAACLARDRSRYAAAFEIGLVVGCGAAVAAAGALWGAAFPATILLAPLVVPAFVLLARGRGKTA